MNNSYDRTGLLYNIEEIINKVNKIIKNIEQSSKGTIALPNIGITYNNKLVNIIQIYKRKGLNANKSSLCLAIQRFLIDLLTEGIKYIESYVEVISKRTNEPNFEQQANSIVEETQKFLKAYKRIDQKIFDFDISKDILQVLQKDIAFFKENGQKGGYDLYQSDNSVITNYNQELQTLGYNPISPSILSENNPTKSETNESSPRQDTVDIKKLVYQRIEQIKIEFKSTPVIAAALESQLIDYLDEAANFYSQGDMYNYESCYKHINQFNPNEEITQSVSKYIAYWAAANSFHNYNEFDKVKKELIALGLGNAIPEIEQNINSNKYQDYIDYRNKIIDEQTAATLQTIDESNENIASNNQTQPKI
ncbi:MAG: hypothetical protein NC483_06620 [Ruminococcus sp.]|nr:hypothetical protein [Ruminococcus sp.]